MRGASQLILSLARTFRLYLSWSGVSILIIGSALFLESIIRSQSNGFGVLIISVLLALALVLVLGSGIQAPLWSWLGQAQTANGVMSRANRPSFDGLSDEGIRPTVMHLPVINGRVEFSSQVSDHFKRLGLSLVNDRKLLLCRITLFDERGIAYLGNEAVHIAAAIPTHLNYVLGLEWDLPDGSRGFYPDNPDKRYIDHHVILSWTNASKKWGGAEFEAEAWGPGSTYNVGRSGSLRVALYLLGDQIDSN